MTTIATTATPALGTPSSRRPIPRSAHRRGSRWFAALVIGLAGFVVIGVGAVVLPTTGLDRLAMSWLVPITVTSGLAHLVAAVGLVRRSGWSASLTGYLAAVGIGVAVYGLLVTLTGLDPFAATSHLPAGEARAEGLGLLVWMIGLWLVAARFALRAEPILDR